MPRNVIVNGGFQLGNSPWTGVDVEFNPETSYISGDRNNRVTEIDGRSGQITILRQDFTVTSTEAVTTNLTFDAALRNSSGAIVGTDGFTVEVFDSAGTLIAGPLTVLPAKAPFQQFSLEVTFPASGASGDTYRVQFTEIGNNDSLGAILDNVELLICFANGTMIRTPNGPVAVETLKAGDVVETMRGPKTLRWLGQRTVSADQMASDPRFAPVRISAGALGRGLPDSDLLVSRQHRLLAQSPVAARMFGASDVLLAAIRLTALPGIYVAEDVREVSYFHLLFDDHEVVFANGALSESMLTGKQALDALSAEARAEIALMFPDLDMNAPDACPVFPVPEMRMQKKFVARLAKNCQRPLHRA